MNRRHKVVKSRQLPAGSPGGRITVRVTASWSGEGQEQCVARVAADAVNDLCEQVMTPANPSRHDQEWSWQQ